MTPELARELENHGARLTACEEADVSQKHDITEIRGWLFWILASSVLGLVGIVIDLIVHHK